MPFPLIKLGYLALKHISKPLANSIKVKAKSTPFLRNRILLPAAQRKYLPFGRCYSYGVPYQ